MLRLIKPFDYRAAYRRILDNIPSDGTPPGEKPRTGLMRGAYAAVQLALHRRQGEDLENDFEYGDATMNLLSCLTPEEFVITFPPEKIYDGEKYGWKDYYTTMEAVRALPEGEPIGDHIEDLLWDYMNWSIRKFQVGLISTVDDLRIAQGKMGLLEEFFGAHTYNKHTAPNGKEFLLGSDGKTVPLQPKMWLLKQ